MNDDLGDIEALCDLVDNIGEYYMGECHDSTMLDMLQRAGILADRIRKQQTDNVILNEKGQRA
jgi:hypothetical protein